MTPEGNQRQIKSRGYIIKHFIHALFTFFSMVLIGCGTQPPSPFDQSMIAGIKAFDEKDFNTAVNYFEKANKFKQDAPDPYIMLAHSFEKSKRYSLARSNYKHLLKIAPDNLDATLGYALLLACCPDNSIRDGKKALELAKYANDKNLSQDFECMIIGVMALSYAELGNYDEALKLGNQFLEHPLQPDDQKELFRKIIHERFRNHQPYRWD